MKKRILAVVLALAMVVTGITVAKPEAKEAKAAGTVENTDMLGIKMQARTNEDGTTDLRIVSSVDSLDYGEVGFQVWYGDAASAPKDDNVTATFTTALVLERIKAGVSYNFSPQVIDTSSKYFVTGTIKGIKTANLGQNFYIKAFCTPTDGTEADRVYGVGRFFNVTDATAAGTINIPMAMDTVAAGTKLTDITVAGTTTEATVTAYLDGYAHLNVTVPSGYTDKTALPSASIVAVGENKTIYRNLESQLKVTGSGSTVTVTGDDTWITKYLELYPTETEFVVANAADLYGLASYSQSNGLPGKTIYLIADIDVNDGKGTASESGFDRSDNATPYPWKPIGHWNIKFQAKFDGNMHTISGVYVNTTSQYSALFAATYGATIQNFRLENSYIESNQQWVGSIVARGYGTFSNIYSNAILKSGAAYQGGMIGQTDVAGSTMSNCWFDGSVINTYSAGANSRGFVGGLIGYSAQNDVLADCLNTGSIDVSQLIIKTRPGVGGLVGVSANPLQIDRCVMLASVKMPGSDCAYSGACYAYVGSNESTLAGSGSYSVQAAQSSEYSTWGGNLNNYDGGTYTMTWTGAYGSLASVTGSVARINMTNLDWVNDWRAIDGKLPMQKVFAEDYVDTDWYDTYKKDGQSYKLKTRQDLYGLAALVNVGVSFAGETIELANDIVINESDVLDFENEMPEYNWEPIGISNNTPFKGILNGNGYSISGLYLNATTRYCGLFGAAYGATIQNLKLTNSYIASTDQWVGSIVARGNGTFESLYSDATVKNASAFTGGLFGQLDNASSSLTKCWFDGTVISTSNNDRGYVGGLIGYAAHQVALTDCLNTGHIDITGTNNANANGTGAGGFIGVNVNSVTINDSAMLGTIKADDQKGYYAIIGIMDNRSFSGSNLYIMKDKWSTEHTSFIANYPGAAISDVSLTNVSYGDVLGDAAKTKMPNLDWNETWQTTSSLPILRGVK